MINTFTWRPYVLADPLAGAISRIGPVLRRTETSAEEQRRLPAEAVDAMRDAGLFRLASPASIGGMEADPVLEMEVYEAVTRWSASAGWTLFVGSLHTSFPAAYLADEAVDAMFGGDDWGIVAGQMQPVGLAREVDGGLVVSGRYSWGSGIAHSEWVLGGVRVSPPDGRGEASGFRVFVAPKHQVNVLDNWHVMGIAGSGSYDYAVEELVVPDGYWFDFVSPKQRRGGARYAMPIGMQLTAAHCGFALGAGERALEEITSLAVTKQRALSKVRVAERGAFQRDLGQAHADLSAARDHAARLLGLQSALRESAAAIPERLEVELRAAATHATDVAVRVAHMALRYAAGTGVRLESPIQRVLRELLVGQSHVYVSDVNYEKLGIDLLMEAGAEAIGDRRVGYR